jgi:hypothetical protein
MPEKATVHQYRVDEVAGRSDPERPPVESGGPRGSAVLPRPADRDALVGNSCAAAVYRPAARQNASLGSWPSASAE